MMGEISADHQALLDADSGRMSAMEAMDIDAIAALLADELIYIHSSGIVDTKQGYLDGLASGHISYSSVRRDEPAIWIVGTLATIYGVVDIHALIDGEPRTLHALSLATWVRRDEAWKLVAIAIQRIVEAR
jgi:Domain of unknown function (DUF4440)